MNNATLALNIARPPAPASATAPTATGREQDGTASKRFDAALDAAHADAHASRDKARDAKDDKAAPAAPASTNVSVKADPNTDRKPAEKDASVVN